MRKRIYKVFRQPEWLAFQQDGAFRGAPDDLRDGYIHFSTIEHLPGTLHLHFAGERDLVVAVVDCGRLEDGALKWEEARNGNLFPHLYAPLKKDAVIAAYDLAHDAKGRPILQDEILNHG